MLVDKSEVFLQRMATTILDAQWVYGGNQLKERAGHLSAEDAEMLLSYMMEQEETQPV